MRKLFFTLPTFIQSFYFRSIFFGILISIFFMFSSDAHSAHVTLTWDANTEPEVAGYKIHYGTSSRNYANSIDVGNQTNYSISGLEEGKNYYFAATAYDYNGSESSFSNEASEYIAVSTVDIVTPSVSITAPEYGATISGTSNIEVVASDDTAVVKVELYVIENGKEVLYATNTSEPFGFSFNTSEFSNGPCELFAKAYDAAGNTGQSEIILVDVYNSLENQTAPMVDDCYPLSGDPGARLTVTVTGSNFQDGATLDFGERIMVQNVTFVNEGQLDVRIKIHPKATTGFRSVIVTNPDGQSDTYDEDFLVN